MKKSVHKRFFWSWLMALLLALGMVLAPDQRGILGVWAETRQTTPSFLTAAGANTVSAAAFPPTQSSCFGRLAVPPCRNTREREMAPVPSTPLPP